MHGDHPARNINLDTALADAESGYRSRTPRSAERYRQACACMPGGNTRSVLHFPPYPVTIERGEGASLWDADGHHYRDLLGEYTAGLYGHSEPRILAAVRDALAGGIVLCAPNRFEVELATLLCERFPCCERVRFTNSGTEGNLMALGLARAASGRETVMIFDGAYHGGVLYFAHGASPVNAPYPVVQGFYNDAARSLEVIERHAADLAAILVEPMQGAGGCIAADVEFLRALREAADRHGIVLIFDEVMTSRLAPGGMQEATGVMPDLTSFGKYIGGGLSFGAFGGRAELMDRFDPRRADALPHAGTFNNNVLTMAAGLTGLRDIYTPAACQTLNARGDRLRDELDALAARRGFPLRVTGVGSILGLHFLRGAVRNVADADRGDQRLAALFHLEMLQAGWYTARRGFMSLMLPLEDRDIDGFLAAADGFMLNNGALANGARLNENPRRTSTMTRNIAINEQRLWDSLMQMAKIGATPKGGVCRVALTDLDREGRDLFKRWCEEAGCTVAVDQFGNMFARRPGSDADALPVATGSHLDSQPTGGRFDGVYGVLAGLEVIRTLNDHDIRTRAPVEVVVWTNEEGARFPPAMVGSGVHVGAFSLEYACGQTDHDGVTQGEALDAIGYRGEEPVGSRRFGAFFETHIEQGPILEAEGKTIGVVQGVQGVRWYDVKVVGAECHAGPTPMETRRDSLAGAAEMLNLIYDIAAAHAPDGRCTVGEFRVYPGSRNTVPGTTEFSVDMRHPDAGHMDEMHAQLLELVAAVGERRALDAHIEEIWYSPPVVFDAACVEAVRKGAELMGYDAMPITSGAGHDSVYISRVAPTAMVFIPCKDGISHNEVEDATGEHCAAGANVLLHAMLERAAG